MDTCATKERWVSFSGTAVQAEGKITMVPLLSLSYCLNLAKNLPWSDFVKLWEGRGWSQTRKDGSAGILSQKSIRNYCWIRGRLDWKNRWKYNNNKKTIKKGNYRNRSIMICIFSSGTGTLFPIATPALSFCSLFLLLFVVIERGGVMVSRSSRCQDSSLRLTTL